MVLQLSSRSDTLQAGCSGLLLGWEGLEKARPIGFFNGDSLSTVAANRQPLQSEGEEHLVTVAPTGAGKFISSVAPILATWRGPAIIVDPKGEAYQCLARRREEMGQVVRLIDPFHTISDVSDGINPFDLLEIAGGSVDSDCEEIAQMLSDGKTVSSDPYWADTGRGLMAGLVAIIAAGSRVDRNFSKLRRMLHGDDLDYDLCVILDTNKNLSRLAREEVIAYLTTPSDKTRPCIRSTAQTFLKSLGCGQILETLDESTFSLDSVLHGDPQTIFIVVPPEKLESHHSYVRLLLHILLTTLARRRVIPALRTLVTVDEAAHIGKLNSLRRAVTLLRGSGVVVHQLYQDLSQISATYAGDCDAILSNSSLQTFGFRNHRSIQLWSEFLGCSPRELRELGSDEQALFLSQRGFVRATKANVLIDPELRRFVARNPRYAMFSETLGDELPGRKF